MGAGTGHFWCDKTLEISQSQSHLKLVSLCGFSALEPGELRAAGSGAPENWPGRASLFRLWQVEDLLKRVLAAAKVEGVSDPISNPHGFPS